MGKSARILGQAYNMTSQEMNYILKKQGFLDGEPGNYFPSESGKQYAMQKDFHRGTGGYAQYTGIGQQLPGMIVLLMFST